MATIRDGPYQNNMFTGRSVSVYGGTFSQTNMLSASQRAFEYLFHMISPTASHNSSQHFDRPKCYPNTRVAVIKEIQEWILRNTNSLPVMWLYGAAGAGKTAIAHTIAAWCEEQNLLLASFFFFRADSARKHIKPFTATLAYGITQSVPAMRPFIERVVELDPNIFSRHLEVQFAKLILEPFECVSLADAPPSLPCVIVIDGLDECVDPAEQKALLQLLTPILSDRMPGWRVLISSRAELAISNVFNNTPLMAISTRLALDSDVYKSEDDIRRFLVDEFEVIKRTHSKRVYIPVDWPCSDTIDRLVRKSSGQFIYAKTVIKYVESEYHSPCRRLDTLLGIREASSDGHDLPFVELDSLYTHILSSSRVADAETTCRVVALCILYLDALCDVNEETLLMNGQEGIEFIGGMMNKDEEELSLILSELASIISFDEEILWFEVLHASLADFLFDPGRSHHLYVDRGSLIAQIACYFFQCFADGIHFGSFPLTYNAEIASPEPSDSSLSGILRVMLEFDTNMIITPELARCFSQIDILSMRQIAADSEAYYDYAKVVLETLKMLKDLAPLYESGDHVYQQNASIFDQWFACGAVNYLQRSPALTSCVATFSIPGLKDFGGFLFCSEEDEEYDCDHLKISFGHDLKNLPYVITEMPQTRALLLDGKTNATAALLLVEKISSDPKWWTSMDGTYTEDKDENVYAALRGLPTVLERAAESSDLLIVLPSRTIIIFEEHAIHFPDEWNAARLAIKSYLERNGVSVSSFYNTSFGTSCERCDIDSVMPSPLDLGCHSTYADDPICSQTYFLGASPFNCMDKVWEVIFNGGGFATWNKFVMILHQDIPSAGNSATY